MSALDGSRPATKTSANSPPWGWDEMIDAFRSLGGTIENITLGEGPLGRGLFAPNPSKPILLRVPENLLFPVPDVEFLSDRVRIKESAAVGTAERNFFENYERSFSWGVAGHSECAALIDALDALPFEIRALLGAEFGMKDLLEGDRVERIRKWFLRSRHIRYHDGDFLMPLVELANHGVKGISYQARDGLLIEGKVDDEVLVSYGTMDPFGLFHGFGFASPEMWAFSLPMKQMAGKIQLSIESNPGLNAKRGNFLVPQLRFDGGNPVLSYLMIGHAKFPRVSRGIFLALMKEAGVMDADAAFDGILHFNRMKFLKLLAALEAHQGAMIVTLRKVARYQLEAMSYCIGSRELDTPVKPEEQAWQASVS